MDPLNLLGLLNSPQNIAIGCLLIVIGWLANWSKTLFQTIKDKDKEIHDLSVRVFEITEDMNDGNLALRDAVRDLREIITITHLNK